MDSDNDSKVIRLRQKLANSSKPARLKRERDALSVSNSAGVAIGDNNTIHVVHTQRVVHSTRIDPNGGELTPEQKQRLQSLVDAVVITGKTKKAGVSHAAIWKRFQRYFRVNTYHALPADSYEAAKTYLKKLYHMARTGKL